MRAGLNLQPQEAHRFHVWTLNSDPIDPLCCEEHGLVSVTHTHAQTHIPLMGYSVAPTWT